MKIAKKTLCVIMSALFIVACFAGCSSSSDEQYKDETLIIGYTEELEPFLQVNEDGTATGFEVDLWNLIFDDIKGDLEDYRFEKVEEGYTLEEDGGFYDSTGEEFSAALLMGNVTKNDGTFNEDYSFSDPIITNRIIALVPSGSEITDYSSFEGANVAVVTDAALEAFEENSAISSVCASVTQSDSIDDALAAVDSGEADVVITDEFSYMPNENADSYTVLDGELDTIEYVIACAKYSDWKNSINDAIYEQKSEEYGDGDVFTPLVEQYFGYNASSFDYVTEAD